MSLYDSIQKTLSKKNINAVIGDIYDLQEVWKQWYRGNVNDFHKYNAIVNGKSKQFERKTLNSAKTFSEEIAKLLWTEKTEIHLDDDNKTDELWKVLDSKKNSFSINFPVFIEKVMALGTGATIEYYDEDNEVVIDYIDGTNIIPYKYTNSYIYGLVTVSQTVEMKDEKKIYITLLTFHEYVGGHYNKKHELYRSMNENELGDQISFKTYYPNVKEEESIETDIPRFQIYRPNLANNYDIDSPMGISVFANIIDILKSIDIKFTSFSNEFELGKKRILVDPSAMKAQTQSDSDGNVHLVQYFDESDTTFVGINGMEDQPVKEIDFSLRVQEHIDAINADINYASINLGLGSNYFRFDGSGLKTATEVISENNKAFRTKTHHDIIINDGVYDLVKAICSMVGIQSNDINIVSDDSIIEDKNTEKMQAQQEVQQGLMSKKAYLMDINGMTEKEAEDMLLEIENEKKSNQEAFGFPVEETPEDTSDIEEKPEENEEKVDNEEKDNKEKEE